MRKLPRTYVCRRCGRTYFHQDRLTKVKVDKILQLFDEGYTKKEIAEKLDVSRGTVSKYIQGQLPRGEGIGDAQNRVLSQIVLELARSIFRLVADLSIAPYVDQDFLTQVADSEALQLMQRIGELDRNFAKSLLSGNAYLEFLKRDGVLDLTVSRNQLDQEGLKQREKWLQLMKEICPEALGEFIT